MFFIDNTFPLWTRHTREKFKPGGFLPDVHAMEHADEKTNSGNELGIQLQESSHIFDKLREFE